MVLYRPPLQGSFLSVFYEDSVYGSFIFIAGSNVPLQRSLTTAYDVP